jgi:hypothetical protein
MGRKREGLSQMKVPCEKSSAAVCAGQLLTYAAGSCRAAMQLIRANNFVGLPPLMLEIGQARAA